MSTTERKAGKKRVRRDYAATLTRITSYVTVSIDVLTNLPAQTDHITGQIDAMTRVLAQIKNGDGGK